MSWSRRIRRANEEAIRKRRWGMKLLSCGRQGAWRTRRVVACLDQSVRALVSPWPGCVRLTQVASENAAEQRLQECCIAQVCAEQVGPTQLGPKQGRIAQVRLAQISAAQIGPEQGGSAQVGAKQVRVAQIRLEQVGVAEIHLTQISPAQAGSDQRWPALWVSPAPLVPSLHPLPEPGDMVFHRHPPLRVLSCFLPQQPG